MRRLALATWRLPQTRQTRVERARRAVEEGQAPDDAFTFVSCQRVLACRLSPRPREAAAELGAEIGVPAPEQRTGFDALGHLARVAASLDALVPGEDQVPAQFREALDEAAGRLDDELLDRLQAARSLAREARDAGDLTGHASRSLVDLAEPLVAEAPRVAVVGTGTIAEEAVQRLGPDRELFVLSRTPERARELAPDPDRAWTRSAFLADPPPVDALVLCSRAEEGHVLEEADARGLLAAREAGTPLRVVDLGVPRNADPRLIRREGLRLSNVEDLAREARARPLDDERVERAREALAEGLARRRREGLASGRDERVVALRRDLAAELEQLAEDVAPGDADLDRWIERAHARLAHASQEHLEAALRGESPP